MQRCEQQRCKQHGGARRSSPGDATKQQQHHPLTDSAVVPALRGTATRQLGDHTLAEMPRTANDGADLLTASDQPKVSPTNASAITAVEATPKKRDIGEMISQISWDQTDIAHEFKLEKVHNRGWRCCCLALSYCQSSKARRPEESTAVDNTKDKESVALQLRQELTEVLMRVLPLEASSTGWSAGMDRARVRIANTPLFLRSPHRALDVPCLYKGAALSAQATSICETDSMMTEVHAHALVNLKPESVVVSHQREVCQENGEATNVITLRAGVG
jgi:hypothetical protein